MRKEQIYNCFVFIGEYALYGLLLSVAISNGLTESFVGLAFLGFLGRKLIKPDFLFLKFLPNIFLLLFLLFSCFSLFNSGEYLNISLRALFGKWLQYILIYIIVQDTISMPRIFKRGMLVFLLSALLSTISGLSQYLFNIEFLRNNAIAAVHGGICAITSSFNHYNDFGGYLVVVFSLLTALLLGRRSLNLKTLGLLTFSILVLFTIALTFSRGSWLAMIISTVFAVLLSKRLAKGLVSISLVIFALFLFPLVRERFLFIFQSGGDSNRFLIWSAIIKMIHEHPFWGMGVGTFMANFCSYLPDMSPYYAHNCYLQIWAETGIFALLSFMAFSASLIFLGIKKFIFVRDYMLLGIMTGIVSFLTHSFFDTNLYSLRLVILFWIWSSFLVVKIREKD
jgi:O-antigen ligase